MPLVNASPGMRHKKFASALCMAIRFDQRLSGPIASFSPVDSVAGVAVATIIAAFPITIHATGNKITMPPPIVVFIKLTKLFTAKPPYQLWPGC